MVSSASSAPAAGRKSVSAASASVRRLADGMHPRRPGSAGGGVDIQPPCWRCQGRSGPRASARRESIGATERCREPESRRPQEKDPPRAAESDGGNPRAGKGVRGERVDCARSTASAAPRQEDETCRRKNRLQPSADCIRSAVAGARCSGRVENPHPEPRPVDIEKHVAARGRGEACPEDMMPTVREGQRRVAAGIAHSRAARGGVRMPPFPLYTRENQTNRGETAQTPK